MRKSTIGNVGSTLRTIARIVRKAGFRVPTHFHIKRAAGIVALEKRKIGLCRLLSKSAITEIRHDADDLDIRFGVRSVRPHKSARPADSVLPGSASRSFRSRWPTASPARPAARTSRSSKLRPATILMPIVSKNARRYSIQIDVIRRRDSFVRQDRHWIVPASACQQREPGNRDA